MGKITQTITTQVTASNLRSDGYKVPINVARNNFDDTICFECKKSKEPNGSSLTLCKNLGPCPTSTPPPAPPPTTGTPTPPTPPSTGTTQVVE